MSVAELSEPVPDLDSLGIRAFTTTRSAGSFGMMSSEAVRDVMGRWAGLRRDLRGRATRLATSTQVHGSRVFVHEAGWDGWLRVDEADGHASVERGTAVAITVADCVPVFIAHPGGAIGLLHAGWRGVDAGILEEALVTFNDLGLGSPDLRLHLGPSICGRCYQVGPDVYFRLTGRAVDAPANVDLRALLAERAAALGVENISTSSLCTSCDNDRFFSHRCGDEGRQVAVMVAEPGFP